MTGTVLLVMGAVALFAAIVGGGVKFRDIEVGSVPSLWRQGLLALFGLGVGFVGLMLVIDEPSGSGGNSLSAVENVASADENSADENVINTVDSNAADANAADTSPNQAGAPQEAAQ